MHPFKDCCVFNLSYRHTTHCLFCRIIIVRNKSKKTGKSHKTVIQISVHYYKSNQSGEQTRWVSHAPNIKQFSSLMLHSVESILTAIQLTVAHGWRNITLYTADFLCHTYCFSRECFLNICWWCSCAWKLLIKAEGRLWIVSSNVLLRSAMCTPGGSFPAERYAHYCWQEHCLEKSNFSLTVQPACRLRFMLKIMSSIYLQLFHLQKYYQLQTRFYSYTWSTIKSTTISSKSQTSFVHILSLLNQLVSSQSLVHVCTCFSSPWQNSWFGFGQKVSSAVSVFGISFGQSESCPAFPIFPSQKTKWTQSSLLLSQGFILTVL